MNCYSNKNIGKPDRNKSKEYFKQKFNFLLSDGNKKLTQFENLNVMENDLERLSPKVYLNDTIINFYIKLLQKYLLRRIRARRRQREAEKGNSEAPGAMDGDGQGEEQAAEPAPKKIHFFNTYFYSTLKQKVDQARNSKGISLEERKSIQAKVHEIHNKQKRQHKRIKLLEVDHVLVPVNKKGEHWTLILICNLKNLKRVVSGEKTMYTFKPTERPLILTLDSLMPADPYICDTLRMYLESELRADLGELYNVGEEGPFMVNDKTLPHHQLLVILGVLIRFLGRRI